MFYSSKERDNILLYFSAMCHFRLQQRIVIERLVSVLYDRMSGKHGYYIFTVLNKNLNGFLYIDVLLEGKIIKLYGIFFV